MYYPVGYLWVMNTTQIETLVGNAKRLGHESQAVVGAITLLGGKAHSVCCWCAMRVDGTPYRLPRGGECDTCEYVGVDCLVIVPESV